MTGKIDKVYWFFLSLYIISVMFIIVNMLIRTEKAQILVGIIIVIAGFALHLAEFNYYRIGSSFYAYGFYLIGYLINKYEILDVLFKRKIYFICSAAVSVIGTAGLLKLSSKILDINNNYCHDILLNYIIAFAGCFIVLYLCNVISDRAILEKSLLRFLKAVGINSFFIFPIADYMPGAFSRIFGNGGMVIKIMAYVMAFVVAFVISFFREKTAMLGKNNK